MTDRPAYTHPPRHADPSPTGASFTPKPMVGRDANPRLDRPFRQGSFDPGTQRYDYRTRMDDGSAWSPWRPLERDFVLPPAMAGFEVRKRTVVSSPRSAPSTAGSDGPDSTS